MKKKKISAVIAAVLAVSMLLGGCSSPEDPAASETPEVDDRLEYELDYHKASDLLKDTVGEKTVAEACKIVDAFLAHEETVTLDLSGLPNGYPDMLGYAASIMCPLFSAFEIYNSNTDLDESTGVLTFRYAADKDKINDCRELLETRVQQMMGELRSSDTQTMRALLLYNGLTHGSYYDYDLPSDVEFDDTDYLLRTSSYSALVQGSGICSSYAQSLAFLFAQAGIDAGTVDSFEGMAHTWVLAKLDGKYYYFDPTWDAGGSLLYFGMTAADRATEWGGGYPEGSCTMYSIVASEKYDITDTRFAPLRDYGINVTEPVEADRANCAVKVTADGDEFVIDCK